jgi:hypothetical protein
MVNTASSANSKSSNKLLMIVALITVIATAWTALQGENVVDGAADELLTTSTSTKTIAVSEPNNPQHAEKLAANDLPNNQQLIPWQNMKREALVGKPYDLFKVHSWLVIPPVKKMKPLPPPPPVAPPAPFTYIGKLEDSPKGTQVFLMANGKLYLAVKGEKINQQWRFDAEDANALRFTYLPLNLPQTLSKSAKPVELASAVLAAPELTH